MTTVLDKAKVSAIAGIFGSITALIYGYANYTVLAGFVTFVLVLMVQYSSFKFKVAISLMTVLGVISYLAYNRVGGH